MDVSGFPQQQLAFNQKGKEWRKRHLDWAEHRTVFNDSVIRQSVRNKIINYNLVNGILDEKDMVMTINPDGVEASYIPEKIQHYPIMNSKLNLLIGEEQARQFDYRVVVTNPTAISEKEQQKKAELLQYIQMIVEATSTDEKQIEERLGQMEKYFKYDWQDLREMRANLLLNHYVKETNMKHMFTQGFMHALSVGEEIYMCDIVGGEPTIELLHTAKVRGFSSGFSSHFEDFDIIIFEDFWSVGKIVDYFYDDLTPKDIKNLESQALSDTGATDAMSNMLPYGGNNSYYSVFGEDGLIDTFSLFTNNGMVTNTAYRDTNGNLRVLRIFWKSRRKIKKIKYYDPQTGEELYDFFPETYQPNEEMGEEETVYWINEAWEATKVGKDVYLRMRPKVVQYNSLSNPSKCHFGIVGSIYSFANGRPFSMVDMMKPFTYLYDAIHDRLNRALAQSWGALIELDLAGVPAGWNIDKWLHYAKINKLAVKDSFKEGNKGVATGKLAGTFTNQSKGVINATQGDSIQMYINALEYIKSEMSAMVGITPQREGQVQNRETVGGVERATLQSSHITEYLFDIHNDVKRRALECFLETAKIAMRGKSKKFQFILPDYSQAMVDLDGDEFAECDYGIVVDITSGPMKSEQRLDQLAQAALQNQILSFKTIMQLYGTASLAEKQKMIEEDEEQMQQRQQQQQEQQLKVQQEIAEQQMQMEQRKLEIQEQNNIRDNETKLLIAQMSALGEGDEDIEEAPEEDRSDLLEKIREFNEKMAFEKKKFKEELAQKKEEFKHEKEIDAQYVKIDRKKASQRRKA